MKAHALVLSGGKGTRLGNLTQDCPKPLLQVGTRPFIEHLFEQLKQNGISDILISVGYLAHKIMDKYGDGKALGLDIEYCFESTPAGTGGAVFLALDQLADEFIVLNGDSYFDIPFRPLLEYLSKPEIKGVVALRPVMDCSRYGAVNCQGNLINCFCEKGVAGPGLINGGIYAFKQTIVSEMNSGTSSLEKDILPRIVEKKQLAGIQFPSYFIDIGTKESIIKARLKFDNI